MTSINGCCRTAAFAIALSSASVHGQRLSPLELNGVALGAPKTALMARIHGFRCDGNLCRLTPWIEIDRRCGRVTTSANFACILSAEAAMRLWSATVIRYTATLAGDRVTSLRASVKTVDYTSLKDALTERYGAPTLVEAVILESYFGERLQGETAIWRLADGVVSATQRTRENICEGEISMSIE
jgi:hypothetical protein